MKIIVRKLKRSITEQQVKKLFMPFGVVSSCTLVIDKESGQSKGFAFVEMAADMDGEKAIKALNNKKIEGLAIKVKVAEEQTEL